MVHRGEVALAFAVICLAVGSTVAEVWGEGNPNIGGPGSDPSASKPITVMKGVPVSCGAPALCEGTGAACIEDCSGRGDGDYQSCQGCGMYATCVYGVWFIDRRPCAASHRGRGLVWDDNKKRCEWKSDTCTENACVGNFNADIRVGMIDSNNKYYTWSTGFPSGPSPTCDASGVLKIDPPKTATKITMRLTLNSIDEMAAFHCAGTPRNDGFGDRFYGYNFGNDPEFHLNFGTFEMYTSAAGFYRFHRALLDRPAPGEDVTICITITKGIVYVSGNALKVTLSHRFLFNNIKPIYCGFNRPITDEMVQRFGGGAGVCAVNVIWE